MRPLTSPVKSLPLKRALQNLPVYQPGRPIEEVARELGLPPETIIKLASNENPLGPSPAALAAMQQVLASLHLYPDGNAFYLKRKLAGKLGLGPENLILGNGSNEIIEFVGHALMGPGVDVVMSQYCFAVYPIVAHLMEARQITVPAKDYGHDLPAMLKALTPNTRVLFVANPNNPTGTLLDGAELRRFLEALPDGVLCVLDEAYAEYAEPEPEGPQLLREGAARLCVLRTFSKVYGLAALRVGYALASLHEHDAVGLRVEHARRARHFLERSLASAGLEPEPSQANFVYADVPGGDADGLAERLLREGYIVRALGGFGAPGAIRVTAGRDEENEGFAEALKRVA